MKRTIENEDGIYPREIVPQNEFWASRQINVNHLLDADGQLADILTDADSRKKATSDPHIREDANSVAINIRELRRILQLGRPTKKGMERAVVLALIIGRLDERLHARQFEEYVRHERKRARNQGPALEKQKKARMKECLEKYDTIIGAKPGGKKSIVAKKCGVSVRTLQEYLKMRKIGKG